MSLVSMDGSCNPNLPTIGRTGLRVSGNRFIFMMKGDNSKGAALVGLLVGRLSSASNRVVMDKRHLRKVGREEMTGCHHGLNMMFRSFHLLGSEGMCRGMTFTREMIGHPAEMVHGHIPRMLRRIKLTIGCGSFPSRLSNKRRREITLTETLIGHPSVLLTSRPAKGLSPGASRRVVGLLRRVGSEKAAMIIIARGGSVMGSVHGHIIAVRRNSVVDSRGRKRCRRT